MVTLTENNTAKIPDGAEVNDQYKKDKFDIDGGKAVRLEGLHRQGNMAYITRVNGVPLLISEDGIEVESDVHYAISSSLVVKQTTIEEAL